MKFAITVSRRYWIRETTDFDVEAFNKKEAIDIAKKKLLDNNENCLIDWYTNGDDGSTDYEFDATPGE